MPYDFKKFVFTVSLCAMLAVNPVLATAPTDDEDLGTTHDVYVESTLNQATNGIAGVSYVNRMVNAAGNAADAAEAHAAAAGAHALSAAQSADEAHEVLKDKVDIDQGADNKNKAMVTDEDGTVYAGYVAPSMIADGGTFDASGPTLYSGFVLWSDYEGNVSWKIVDDQVITDGAVSSPEIADGGVRTDDLANGAVTSAKIADSAVTSAKIVDGAVTTTKIAREAVTSAKIADGAVTSGVIARGAVRNWHIYTGAVTSETIANSAVTTDKIAPDTGGISGVLITEPAGVSWGKINNQLIDDGAVTIDKTAGVVGMVPVGGEGATTYGSFWIE